MALWIAMAVLTAAAAIALLAPLFRSRVGTTVGEAEKAIYRDQLDEIDRDVARGVLAPGEAEAARNEIKRRLIKADEQAADTAVTTSSRPRIAALAAVVVLPAVGLALYPWWLGSPGQRDMPIEERLANPRADDPAALASLLGDALEASPDEPQLWMLAAQVYMETNDFDGVATAYENLIRLQPDTFDTTGETGMLLADGIFQIAGGVVEPAVRISEVLLSNHPERFDDPRFVNAQIFLAVSLAEAGQRDEAVAAWQHILTLAPPEGAPWVTMAQQQLAALQGMVPGANPAMPVDIGAAVRNLAAELISNPQNAEGWMRLIRSYVVLADLELARQAVTSARSAFAGNDQAIQMIEGGVISTPGAALTADPGDAEAWAQLIRSYSVLGRTEQATDAVGQARGALAGNPEGLALIDAVAQELEQR